MRARWSLPKRDVGIREAVEVGDAATRGARSASRPESMRIGRHAAASEEGSCSPPISRRRRTTSPASSSRLSPSPPAAREEGPRLPPISLLRRLVSRASRPLLLPFLSSPFPIFPSSPPSPGAWVSLGRGRRLQARGGVRGGRGCFRQRWSTVSRWNLLSPHHNAIR